MIVIIGLVVLFFLCKWRLDDLAKDQARGSVYVGRGYHIVLPEEPKPTVQEPVTWPNFRRCQRQRKV